MPISQLGVARGGFANHALTSCLDTPNWRARYALRPYFSPAQALSSLISFRISSSGVMSRLETNPDRHCFKPSARFGQTIEIRKRKRAKIALANRLLELYAYRR